MDAKLRSLKERVLAEGPFRRWKHESANQARPDLRNLVPSAQAVQAQCRDLVEVVMLDSLERTRLTAFAILQNIFPIVEAIDTDAGLYVGQAVEALRKKGAADL